MTTEIEVKPYNGTSWKNYHKTYSIDTDHRYELHRSSGNTSTAKLNKSAQAILEFIEKAKQSDAVIRPFGGTWSFSQIAGEQDAWLLDTSYANWKVHLSGWALSDQFNGTAEELLFVQCGASIHEINRHLEKRKGRSLYTSGASNGQTFVGAMSTGTHGSAVDYGAMQNQVAAIQLLSVNGQNLWLERPNDHIISQEFANQIGTEIVRDNDFFDAALVSLGMLGIIHSVVIRTQPIFRLSASQYETPYDDNLKHIMKTLDFSSLDLPDGITPPNENDKPYFFQVVVNHHKDEKTAHVKIMYKTDYNGETIDYSIKGKYGVGYDVTGVLAKLLDTASSLTPVITNLIVSEHLKPFKNEVGTWGETFDFTTPRKDTAGAAMAVPREKCVEAIDAAIRAYEEFGPAPVVFACRFVEKSAGLLAFTKFDHNCVIDIDGLNNNNTQLVMEAVRREFDKEGIPYAQHWGKFHDLTNGRLEKSYGNNLQKWKTVRDQILPTEADKKLFSITAGETVIGKL